MTGRHLNISGVSSVDVHGFDGVTYTAELIDPVGALEGIWKITYRGKDYLVTRAFLRSLGTVIDNHDLSVV